MISNSIPFLPNHEISWLGASGSRNRSKHHNYQIKFKFFGFLLMVFLWCFNAEEAQAICNAGTNQVALTGNALNGCSPATVNLNSLVSGAAPSGTVVEWHQLADHTDPAYTTPGTATSGTYYAFFFDATNSCYNTATSTSVVTVTINTGAPATPGTITGLQCITTPISGGINYSVTPVSGATSYNWTYPQSTSFTSPVVQNGSSVTFTNSYGNSGTLSVTATNSCGTSAASTLPITVFGPSITSSGDANVCPSGGSILLTSTPATSYQWYFNNVAIGGAISKNYPAAAAGSYYVTGSQGSCSNIASTPITVVSQDITKPNLVSGSTMTVLDTVDFDRETPIESSRNLPLTFGTGAASVKITQSVPGIADNRIPASGGMPVGSYPVAAVGKGNILQLSPSSSLPNYNTSVRDLMLNFPQPVTNLHFTIFDIDGNMPLAFSAYSNGVLQAVNIANLVSNGPVVSNSGTVSPSAIGPNGAFAFSSMTQASRTALNVTIPGTIDNLIITISPNVANGDANIFLSDLLFQHTEAVLATDVTTTCDAIPVAPTYTATDNCGAAVVTYVQNPATYVPSATQNTITRTWTATDAASNTTVHTQTITVNPTLTAPVVGTVTQPVSPATTGSVALSGLPATGSWTLTTNPGNINMNGTGTTTTVSGLPSGTYTFSVATTDCVSPTSTATINGTPLPVTLIDFNAVQKECEATVYWKTGVEAFISNYELMRSIDAKTFVSVATVYATGNSSSYKVAVENGSDAWFRLKINEADGSYSYGNLLKLATDCTKMPMLVSPNPTSGALKISGLQGGEIISVMDLTGRTVLSNPTIKNGSINLENVAAGMYLLRVTKHGSISTTRIYKK